MNDTPPYQAAKLKSFVSRVLKPKCPPGFSMHGRRSLIRAYGNALQMLTLSGGRYGETLQVSPTLYVVGAFPWDEVVTGTVSWSVFESRPWTFQQTALDEALGERIVSQLAPRPISYFDSPTPALFQSWLELFAARRTTEVPSVFLAFFLMACKSGEAKPHLERARKLFARKCPHPSTDWQRATMIRIELLIARSASDTAWIECRTEAEEHAKRLGIPEPSWPN